VLGPGEHGGGVERSLGGGAVAGGLAAAGLEQVDGALDELAEGEHLIELALVLPQQGFEGQAQTAGAVRASGQRQFSFCLLYIIKT